MSERLALNDVTIRLLSVARNHAEHARYGGAAAEMHMRYETTCSDAIRAIRDLREEIDAAWDALGTTAAEAADDPDTARLADSIRISAQYDREKFIEANELVVRLTAELAEVKKTRDWLSASRDRLMEYGDDD